MSPSPYFGDVQLEQALECVGPGWHPIVKKLYDNKPEDVKVHQVKEKFGGLRFYTSVSNEQYTKMIEEAEREASKTCWKCGAPGENRNVGGWWQTICDNCAESY